MSLISHGHATPTELGLRMLMSHGAAEDEERFLKSSLFGLKKLIVYSFGHCNRRKTSY